MFFVEHIIKIFTTLLQIDIYVERLVCILAACECTYLCIYLNVLFYYFGREIHRQQLLRFNYPTLAATAVTVNLNVCIHKCGNKKMYSHFSIDFILFFCSLLPSKTFQEIIFLLFSCLNFACIHCDRVCCGASLLHIII